VLLGSRVAQGSRLLVAWGGGVEPELQSMVSLGAVDVKAG
jgi:hypothetical protein